MNDDYKKTIIALVSALIPNAKIYLFGSRARKTHDERSDIDIALDVGKKLDFVEVGQVREVLNSTNIPNKIDVVDYHSVSKDMQEMIDEEKVVWKN